jgi:hypothetical protein
MSVLTIAIVSCTFIWAGFVSSISFMEAWLKFRAPGVTLRAGLSIGRQVFSALNKVECVFAFAISAMLLLTGTVLPHTWIFAIPLVMLLVQTILILPILNSRTDAILNFRLVPPSQIHFYFVIAEVAKVISLILFAALTCATRLI